MVIKIEIYTDCVCTGNFEFIRTQSESLQKMKTGLDLASVFIRLHFESA